MGAEPLYFGRKYRLSITPPEGDRLVLDVQEDTTPLDIKFDVTYAIGQVAREGTVSILGLGWDTIEPILEMSAMARGDALAEHVHLKLEAGYLSKAGMVEIFDGYIYYATVTSPPEMWVNLKISEVNPYGGPTCDITVTDLLTPRDIVQGILDKFSKAEGVNFRLVDKTKDKLFDNDKEKTKFSMDGDKQTLKAVLQKLSDWRPKYVFTLATIEAASNDRIVEVHSKEGGDAGDEGEDVRVDKDNGLLSVSGIDAVSGHITTFIDGRWKDKLSHIRLKSELNPQANGRYRILKKQYTGHYTGKEWYTKYFCSNRVRG